MGVSLEAILADLGLEEPLDGYLSTREWAERVRQHEEHLAQRAERQAQRADAPGR